MRPFLCHSHVVLKIEARDPENNNYTALPRHQLEYVWENKVSQSSSSSAGVGKKQASRKRKLDQVEDQEDVEEDADESGEEVQVFGSYLEYPPLHRLLENVPTESKLFNGASSGETTEATEVQEESNENQESVSTLTISVTLDKLSPLAEAKWLKTGNVNEWLSSVLPASSSSSSASSKVPKDSVQKLLSSQIWFNKIKVSDPDPPPTIQDVFNDWSSKSFLGQPKDRRKFLKDFLSDSQGMIEILCRLVRGERASTSTSTRGSGDKNGGAPSSGDRDDMERDRDEDEDESNGDPLEKAKKLTNFSSNHTHLSLGVMALFGLTRDYSLKAGVEEEEFKKKIGEILKSLPEHLVFKSLDGLVSIGMHSQTEERERTLSIFF